MNTPAPEDRAHHPYSPSTLQNREACPCYESRQQDKPHERTTAGTRAHAVTDSGQDDLRLGDDDAAAVAECLDFWARRCAILQEEADRATEDDRRGNILPATARYTITELKETYLPIDDLVFPDCKHTTAGYVDRVVLNYSRLYAEAADWKFGMWPVEDAANNLQGICYSLGIFKMFPTVEKVRFFFKQPHLDHVSDALFTRDQIPALYLRVQTVVARAREAKLAGDFKTATPYVPVCNFCANIGKCPKVFGFACKVAHKFHPVEMPEHIDPSVGTDPLQTVFALRLSQVLKVWCDAFRRQVTDRILRGDAPVPPGQKIQTLEKREVVDPAKMREVALKYMTQAEYDSTLDTTFGALETLISDAAPRGQKENTVLQFRQALLDSGAVKKLAPISFLRAVAVKA